MLGQRKRRRSLASRRTLTLHTFEQTLARIEAEAMRSEDRTLEGVVILFRAFVEAMRERAAIS